MLEHCAGHVLPAPAQTEKWCHRHCCTDITSKHFGGFSRLIFDQTRCGPFDTLSRTILDMQSDQHKHVITSVWKFIRVDIWLNRMLYPHPTLCSATLSSIAESKQGRIRHIFLFLWYNCVGTEPTIHRTRSRHSDHWATEVVKSTSHGTGSSAMLKSLHQYVYSWCIFGKRFGTFPQYVHCIYISTDAGDNRYGWAESKQVQSIIIRACRY